jgi:hypothetical protein
VVRLRRRAGRGGPGRGPGRLPGRGATRRRGPRGWRPWARSGGCPGCC